MDERSIADRLEVLSKARGHKDSQSWNRPRNVRLYDHALLLYEQNTCNAGLVQVICMPESAHRVKSSKWFVKILLQELRDRAPEIYLANAIVFEGTTPDEALEKAEFYMGMENLKRLA